MSSVGTDFSMMTTKGGNEELLYVLDSRSGRLFVYEPRQNGQVPLLDVVDSEKLISQVRQKRRNP